MKRVLAIILTACMVLTMSACSQSAPPASSTPVASSQPAASTQSSAPPAPTVKPIEIKYATILVNGDPMVDAMQKFADLVKQKSGGAIKVNLFPGGVLGNERELLEALRTGAVNMTASSSLADTIFFAPKYAIFSTPYLIKDLNHAKKVWDSEVGKEINNYVETNTGIKTLGFMDRGSRQLTANKAINTPDDLKGLKLRLPENEVYIKVWSTLGATPVPVAFSEIYGALQTGAISAQENPLATIAASKFNEVQKYCMLTNHIVEMYKIQCDKTWWSKLDSNQTKIIEESLAEASKFGSDLVAKSNDDLISKLKASGMTFVQPDVDKFKEKALPVMQELGRSYFKEGLMEKVINIK